MTVQPPPRSHIRAGVSELVLDLARTSITESYLDTFTRRLCLELTELCGLSACVVLLMDSTGSVRALIGSRPEAEQLTRLVHQLGFADEAARAHPSAQRFGFAQDLTSARTVVAEAAGKVGLPVTASIRLYGLHEPVGYLQLFGSSLEALGEELLRELLPLADALGTALHDSSAYQYSAELVTQLSEALDAQRPIEQAKGLVAQRHQIDLDTAYRMLREQARRRDTTVRQVAAEVVAQYWHPSNEHTPAPGEPVDPGTAPLPEQRRLSSETDDSVV
jgi:ANTAR domain-containing protein